MNWFQALADAFSFNTIVGTAIIGAIAGLSIIQIAPIHINPWSWIAKKIGKGINGELIEKVDSLAERMERMEGENKENYVNSARTRILRFSNELYYREKHSKELFEQTLDDISFYEGYCREHPEYKNSKAEESIKLIKKTYEKLMMEHGFLGV